MSRRLRNWLAGAKAATELWRGPVMLGLIAALFLWVVWYFTKAPCTMENAHAGLCNAAPIARYIDHHILGQCILLGIAVAALRGGYNEIMVSRERKRADDAEQRADKEKRRADDAHEKLHQERESMAEKMAEMRAERERLEAERRAERERLEAERRAERERLEAERRAERERLEAERRAEQERLEAERRAERELDRAERQAILNTMVQINNTLSQLVANQQNGPSSSGD